MSLESGNYLSNLVSSNPTGADRKLQGDDHLRLIKSTLQNSFAGITGAIVVGGVNGGVANTYTLTPTPPLVSYVDNMSIVFSPTVANTGASTINISGLGAVNILSVAGVALTANDLVVGQKYRATFDGANFRLFSVTKNYVDQLAFSTALPAQSLGFLASNGSSAAFTRTFNGYAIDESKGANVASAATIDLQNTIVTGNLLHITGTTTITAITLPSGAERTLVFDGILTLTHSANLDLPGSVNITTAVGDRAIIRGEGSGVVRVISYNKANGAAVTVVPPALILLATLTPTVAANVDFLNTFNSTYDAYMIEIIGVRPATAGNILRAQFAVAGSAVTTSTYATAATGSSATAASAFMTIGVATNNSATFARTFVNSTLFAANINNTASAKSLTSFSAQATSTAGTFQGDTSWSVLDTASVVTGIRFFWNGGSNFDAVGSIKIYGIANS